jgi:hypothetical protein
MEKHEFSITRKVGEDGEYFYTVRFGWPELTSAGTTTRVFNTRLQAIGFINDELQKDPGKLINGTWYPSHVVKLFNRTKDIEVPAIRLGSDHFLNKVGMRWVHFNSVKELDGTLIYYHRKHWYEA